MEFLSSAASFLNDTLVKTILFFVGGAILKKWEPFVNKAIPFTKLVASALLSAIAVMFPAQAIDAAPGSFVYGSFAGLEVMAAASAPARLGSWVWNTLAPIAATIATHSFSKNTAEWAKLGCRLFWPAGGPAR